MAENEKVDPTNIFEFHMKEYVSLRSQLASHVDSIRVLERYVAAAVAGVYSWMLLKHHDIGQEGLWDPTNLLWYVPVVVVSFGWVRTIAMTKRTKKLANYTQQIENKYADSDLGGWEHFLSSGKSSGALLSRNGLWIFLLGGSLILSVPSHILHQGHDSDGHSDESSETSSKQENPKSKKDDHRKIEQHKMMTSSMPEDSGTKGDNHRKVGHHDTRTSPTPEDNSTKSDDHGEVEHENEEPSVHDEQSD